MAVGKNITSKKNERGSNIIFLIVLRLFGSVSSCSELYTSLVQCIDLRQFLLDYVQPVYERVEEPLLVIMDFAQVTDIMDVLLLFTNV